MTNAPAGQRTASAAGTQPLLEVRDLRVDFRVRGSRPLAAVDGVDLSLAAGETVGIVGESGSGKSTLARAIIGLTEVTSGSVRLEGRDITRLRGRARSALASTVQYVFQDPFSSLNPTRTIADALGEPLLATAQLSRSQRQQRITEMLELVGMPTDTAGRYPGSFSGGQRQRIAIARALIVSPKLVICDEPTSALDLSIQAQVLTLLKDLQQRFSVGYLFITHNLDVVRYMSDRTVVVRRGRVVEEGPAERIATAPTDPYTRALVAATPLADPVAQAAARRRRQAEAAVRPDLPPEP